jgi:hypothetical protein
MIDVKLPQILGKLREAPTIPMSDFLKLVELQRRLRPRVVCERRVIWLDFIGDDEVDVIE